MGAVSAGALLLAVLTHAVAAVPGYQVVRTDHSVAAGGFLRSIVTCPAGKKVLGGGAKVVGAGPQNFKTSIQESGPGAVGSSQSGWLTAIRNNDPTPHTIGLFAVCATAPTGHQVVSGVTIIVVAGDLLRSVATCPAGKKVLSGGAQVVGEGSRDFKTSIQESALLTLSGQSVWLTTIRNNDATPHTIRLFAVCATAPTGYQVISNDAVLIPGNHLHSISTCPVGKVVLGGGAQVIGQGTQQDFKTSITASVPDELGSQSVWLTVIRSDLGSASQFPTIHLSAVCATK